MPVEEGGRWTSVLAGLSVAFALSLFVASAPAFAHAQLMGETPEPDAALPEPPQQVSLSFSEPVDAAFDPIRVLDERGERVDAKDARTEPGDPETLSVGVENLSAGDYTVDWRVTSVDGHVVDGEYAFSVTGAADGSSAESGGAGREPAEQGTTRGAVGALSSTLLFSAASLGLAAVAVLALVAATVLRRRKV